MKTQVLWLLALALVAPAFATVTQAGSMEEVAAFTADNEAREHHYGYYFSESDDRLFPEITGLFSQDKENEFLSMLVDTDKIDLMRMKVSDPVFEDFAKQQGATEYPYAIVNFKGETAHKVEGVADEETALEILKEYERLENYVPEPEPQPEPAPAPAPAPAPKPQPKPQPAPKQTGSPIKDLNRPMEEENRTQQVPIITYEPEIVEPFFFEPPFFHEPIIHEPFVHEPFIHEPFVHEPFVHEPFVREPFFDAPWHGAFRPGFAPFHGFHNGPVVHEHEAPHTVNRAAAPQPAKPQQDKPTQTSKPTTTAPSTNGPQKPAGATPTAPPKQAAPAQGKPQNGPALQAKPQNQGPPKPTNAPKAGPGPNAGPKPAGPTGTGANAGPKPSGPRPSPNGPRPTPSRMLWGMQ